MREALGELEGSRKRFTATIARIGKKNNFKGPPSETVLLRDVRDEQGAPVTDHVWFVIGKTLSGVFHHVGKKISFEARVASYTKGHKGRGLQQLKPQEQDFRLSNPTKVTIL